MKKIVGSAIVAIVVTVGTYLAALALGASEPAAVATTFVVVFAAAFVVFAAAFALVAAATAFSFVVVAFAAAFVVSTFAFALVAALAVAAAFVVAEQEGIRFRWAFTAYALETVAIWAFMVSSVGWSIAIALTGVIALLILWRFAPKPNPAEQAAIVCA